MRRKRIVGCRKLFYDDRNGSETSLPMSSQAHVECRKVLAKIRFIEAKYCWIKH
jgi:hypothetical protein